MKVRARTWWLAASAICLALVGGLLVSPLLHADKSYASVQSIEAESSYHDPALLAEAWQLPVALSFKRDEYEFQSNPSFCGPASAANVMRSLGTPISQKEVLHDTPYEPTFGILVAGLTLDQEADLLKRRTGRPVELLRDLSLIDFRAQMREVNDLDRRYVVNFHRGPLFGRGGGHFSPLLAYLPDKDLVLVGDVNRSYQPFLVSSARLWQASNTIDSETGKKRGLLLLHR